MAIADRVVQAGLRFRDLWLASHALLCVAWDAIAWGRPDISRAYCRRLFDLSRETGDPRAMSMGFWALAFLNDLLGEYDEAIENAEESLRIGLSHVDRGAAIAFTGVAMIFTGNAEEGREILEDMGQRWEPIGFLAPLQGAKAYLAVAKVMTGEFAAGIRYCEEATREYVEAGHVGAQPLGDLILGKIYSAMVHGERPPLSVLLKNLWFVLTVAPFAAKKARRHFEAAERGYRALDAPYYVADPLVELAMLDLAAKRPDDARTRLLEAKDIVAEVGGQILADKIEAELAKLG